MPSRTPWRIHAALASAALVVALGGCAEKTGKASADVNALKNLIDIPADVKSGQWEMFGTPEYDGGVPGPTDYMTLIADIEPAGTAADFTKGANDTSVYIVPEAARPWLSTGFRTVLETHRNASLDLATVPGCRSYSARIKSSGRVVSGFSCADAGRVLLYLSLF